MNQNPLQTAIQMMNAGRNPIAWLQQISGSYPQIAQAMQIINGKSPQQLQQIAANMAREKGLNITELIRGLGINLPQ